DNLPLYLFVVVAVVECARTGQKVRVGFARLRVQQRALGPLEEGWERPAVASDVRLALFKDIHRVMLRTLLRDTRRFRLRVSVSRCGPSVVIEPRAGQERADGAPAPGFEGE